MKQWFPRINTGLLSQMLWSWKCKKWESFGKNEDERLEALRKLIGEEAKIGVAASDPENSNSVKVTKVSALDMNPSWADEVDKAD